MTNIATSTPNPSHDEEPAPAAASDSSTQVRRLHNEVGRWAENGVGLTIKALPRVVACERVLSGRHMTEAAAYHIMAVGGVIAAQEGSNGFRITLPHDVRVNPPEAPVRYQLPTGENLEIPRGGGVKICGPYDYSPLLGGSANAPARLQALAAYPRADDVVGIPNGPDARVLEVWCHPDRGWQCALVPANPHAYERPVFAPEALRVISRAARPDPAMTHWMVAKPKVVRVRVWEPEASEEDPNTYAHAPVVCSGHAYGLLRDGVMVGEIISSDGLSKVNVRNCDLQRQFHRDVKAWGIQQSEHPYDDITKWVETVLSQPR